jgi:hypothetical protein
METCTRGSNLSVFSLNFVLLSPGCADLSLAIHKLLVTIAAEFYPLCNLAIEFCSMPFNVVSIILCPITFCCCLLITMLACGAPVSEILNAAPVLSFVQNPQRLNNSVVPSVLHFSKHDTLQDSSVNHF